MSFDIPTYFPPDFEEERFMNVSDVKRETKRNYAPLWIETCLSKEGHILHLLI